MYRRLLAPVLAICLVVILAPLVVVAQTPPATWEGLSRVKAKRFDAAYMLPGADFRIYTKVILDPTEVAFEKNWVRDYNRTQGISNRIDEKEAQEVMDAARTGFEAASRKGFANAGYQIVTEPGPDVMRVRTGVANIRVSAPELQMAGRSKSYASEAGSAMVIIELRDSVTGALLGRAVDGRTAGDTGPMLRNSMTNRSDFTRLFNLWVKASVEGLAELKAQSPVNTTAAAKR